MEDQLLESLYQSAIQMENIKAHNVMNHLDSAGVWMQEDMRSQEHVSEDEPFVNLQVNYSLCLIIRTSSETPYCLMHLTNRWLIRCTKGSPSVDAETSSHKPEHYLMNIVNSRSSEYVRL